MRELDLRVFTYFVFYWFDELAVGVGGSSVELYVEGVIRTVCFLHLRFYVLNLTGKPTSYGFFGGSLQEFHWFKECYGSWFLGNYVCEGKRKSCLV